MGGWEDPSFLFLLPYLVACVPEPYGFITSTRGELGVALGVPFQLKQGFFVAL